ncbi:MAG: hypothetical protein IPQ21_03190 [Betaproteobacteria bacterium]|nr:hypothetical protein [Betaproteobacteria bacterium]
MDGGNLLRLRRLPQVTCLRATTVAGPGDAATHARPLTLVELMVVVAVVAIVLTLAAPSFRDFILLQRLKGINAQLVTDLQFARSEAVARGTLMRVQFLAERQR